MKINKEHSTVFDESCLQSMASLTGRWQGLKLVSLRALNRDQSRLTIGIIRDNLGLVGSAAPANLFSSLSQPACRLNPHPYTQVYKGKLFVSKKLAVYHTIWSGEFWTTSTFSFHPDTRNTESLLSKGTKSSLVISLGRRLVQYQMSSISSLQFLPGRAVLEGGGTFDVPTIAAAKGSPLAKLLFRLFHSKTRPHGWCV